MGSFLATEMCLSCTLFGANFDVALSEPDFSQRDWPTGGSFGVGLRRSLQGRVRDWPSRWTTESAHNAPDLLAQPCLTTNAEQKTGSTPLILIASPPRYCWIQQSGIEY